jgi:hypothetical protein
MSKAKEDKSKSSECVQVVVRVRPLSSQEKKDNRNMYGAGEEETEGSEGGSREGRRV